MVHKKSRGGPRLFLCYRVLSFLHYAAEGGAACGGDAEEVGAGRTGGEVDAAVGGTLDETASVVVDIDALELVGLNGDKSRGGVGVEEY